MAANTTVYVLIVSIAFAGQGGWTEVRLTKSYKACTREAAIARQAEEPSVTVDAQCIQVTPARFIPLPTAAKPPEAKPRKTAARLTTNEPAYDAEEQVVDAAPAALPEPKPKAIKSPSKPPRKQAQKATRQITPAQLRGCKNKRYRIVAGQRRWYCRGG